MFLHIMLATNMQGSEKAGLERKNQCIAKKKKDKRKKRQRKKEEEKDIHVDPPRSL